MWKNIRKDCPKYAQCAFWKHLLVPFPLWRVLFWTCFSEPLGGTPFDRFWLALGQPWSDYIDLLKDVGSKLGSTVKG